MTTAEAGLWEAERTASKDQELSTPIAPKHEVQINSPSYWRERVKEMHSIAEALSDPEAKEAVLRIAEEYHRLAKHAEDRLSRMMSDRLNARREQRKAKSVA